MNFLSFYGFPEASNEELPLNYKLNLKCVSIPNAFISSYKWRTRVTFLKLESKFKKGHNETAELINQPLKGSTSSTFKRQV